MYQLLKVNQFTNFVILFFIIALLSNCTPEKDRIENASKIDVALILQESDTLSAKEVYNTALKIIDETQLDDFYKGIFEQKVVQNDTKSIKEHIGFYKKLRGGNPKADILLEVASAAIMTIENQIPESLKVYEKILALASNINDTLNISEGFIGMAKCHSRMGNYKKAVQYGLQGLSYVEAIGNLQKLADLRFDIGGYLFYNQNYEDCIQLTTLALDYYMEQKDKRHEAFAYIQIGRVAERQDDTEKTVLYYDKALEVRKTLDDPTAVAESYAQYANFWLTLENYDKALEKAKQADLWNKKGAYRGLDNGITALLGRALCGTNNYEMGKEKLLFALENAQKSKDTYSEMAIYQFIYEAAKNAKRFEESLNYCQKYIKTKSIVFNEEKQATIDELNIKYKTAEKDKAIAIADNKHKVAKLQNYIYSLVTLVLFGIGIALYFRYRGQRQILHQKNQLLTQEKELILAREQLKTKAFESSQQALQTTTSKLNKTAQLLDLKSQLVEDLKIRLNEQELETEKSRKESVTDFRTMKILNETQWYQFKDSYETAFPMVLQKIKTEFSSITEAELRLFLLIKLKFDIREIANTLGISKGSVYRSRHRLTAKLNLNSSNELDDFIANY